MMFFCMCLGDDKEPRGINTEKKPLITNKKHKTSHSKAIDDHDDEKLKDEASALPQTGLIQNISHQKQTPFLLNQPPISVFNMTDEEKAQEPDGDGRIFGDGRELYGDGRIPHILHPSFGYSNESNLVMEMQKLPDIQSQILNDMDLKQQAMQLVTERDGAFLKFVNKYLNAERINKMWNKIDIEQNGYIETAEDITDAILSIAMLYKTKMNQKYNQTGRQININRQEVMKATKHIAIWIVRRYGEKDINTIDKVYVFRITSDEFEKNLKKWLEEYLKWDGSLIDKVPKTQIIQ